MITIGPDRCIRPEELPVGAAVVFRGRLAPVVLLRLPLSLGSRGAAKVTRLLRHTLACMLPRQLHHPPGWHALQCAPPGPTQPRMTGDRQRTQSGQTPMSSLCKQVEFVDYILPGVHNLHLLPRRCSSSVMTPGHGRRSEEVKEGTMQKPTEYKLGENDCARVW